MKDKEKKIDDFLLDRLPEAEKAAFEAALAADADLSAKVKVQEEIIGGLAVVGRDQFKERLRRIQAEVRAEGDVSAVPLKEERSRRWMLWAGLLALGLLLTLLWLTRTKTVEPAVIYADVFEVYDISISQRDPSERDLMEELDAYYRNREYDRFITRLDGQEGLYPHHPELYLSLGISYLETNQLEKADEVLLTLENSEYQAYKDHARWYRALAALKGKDIDKTKLLLEDLVNDTGADHHQEAKRLTQRL